MSDAMRSLRENARAELRIAEQVKVRELYAPHIVDAGDVPDTDDSDSRRYETGLSNVDRRMQKIRPGEFVVIGARQGHGKTALAEMIAHTNALRHRVLFASLEMLASDVRDRMLARMAGVPLDTIEYWRATGDMRYREWCDAFATLRLQFFRPENPANRTSASVMRAAEVAEADMLIVDYTREMSDWEPGNTRICSEIVSRFSMWSKATRATVVLISQLGRDAQGRKPLESQLQDTGRLEQAAEKIILLYRPFIGEKGEDHVTEIIVAKNRRGPAFRTHAHWHGPTTTLTSMTDEEEAVAPCCLGKKA